jgi:hypothetical protein
MKIDHNGTAEEPNKVLINLILTKIQIKFGGNENRSSTTKVRRKKKTWRYKAKQKGKTIFVLAENKYIMRKQSILRGRSNKTINLLKSITKFFEKYFEKL